MENQRDSSLALLFALNCWVMQTADMSGVKYNRQPAKGVIEKMIACGLLAADLTAGPALPVYIEALLRVPLPIQTGQWMVPNADGSVGKPTESPAAGTATPAGPQPSLRFRVGAGRAQGTGMPSEGLGVDEFVSDRVHGRPADCNQPQCAPEGGPDDGIKGSARIVTLMEAIAMVQARRVVRASVRKSALKRRGKGNSR